MLITLSGLDGAGKSTLIEALRKDLEEHGVRTTLLHMNKQIGIYAYVRHVRDALLGILRPVGSGASEPTVHGSAKSRDSRISRMRHRILWGKELRRVVDAADLALFLLYRLYIEKGRGRVLVMDRYFYDRLVDTADGQRWAYLRWFSRLTPVPDLSIFVDVSPEVAFARKGEFSISWLARRRANYREIFSWVPSSVILPNDDVERAATELKRLVHDRMIIAGYRRLAVES